MLRVQNFISRGSFNPMDCCSNVSKPVFVETNLGTRLAAVPVSPHITAKEFKGELERMHMSCFPELGRIKVNTLKVKKRSRFYHLSESLPLKYAFLDSNAIWFLQMDALLIEPLNSNIGILSVLKRKKKRKNRMRKMFPKNNVIAESHNEKFSDVVSVSEIVKKYFSNDDEVGPTTYSAVQTRNERKYYLSREAHAKPEVGKRLLLASDNIGLKLSNRRPLLSLCKFGNKKSPVIRNLVFEMTSEESE